MVHTIINHSVTYRNQLKGEEAPMPWDSEPHKAFEFDEPDPPKVRLERKPDRFDMLVTLQNVALQDARQQIVRDL